MISENKLQGIFVDLKKKSYYTKSLAPGIKVYDERLIEERGIEYREWNPRKSKLAAALVKGISQIGIKPGSMVLYLGCSTGTTVSHVSDLVAEKGFVFAIDNAPRVMREMVFVAEQRKNIAPILADAKHPEFYIDMLCQVDVVYQDIAQKDQLSIFLRNCNLYLKKDGFALLFVKARSIDVTKNPVAIYQEIRKVLEKEMAIVDYKQLDPLERDHCVFVCKKK